MGGQGTGLFVGKGAPLPGGQYWCHLFVVGAEAGQTRLQDDVLIEGRKSAQDAGEQKIRTEYVAAAHGENLFSCFRSV